MTMHPDTIDGGVQQAANIAMSVREQFDYDALSFLLDVATVLAEGGDEDAEDARKALAPTVVEPNVRDELERLVYLIGEAWPEDEVSISIDTSDNPYLFDKYGNRIEPLKSLLNDARTALQETEGEE